nr:hypothetical protein [Tanacetum cinerariifolium]
ERDASNDAKSPGLADDCCRAPPPRVPLCRKPASAPPVAAPGPTLECPDQGCPLTARQPTVPVHGTAQVQQRE